MAGEEEVVNEDRIAFLEGAREAAKPRLLTTKRCLVASAASLFPLAFLASRGLAAGQVYRPASSSASTALYSKALQTCTEYFAADHDCSAPNYWSCSHDDGSLGYRCCCYGDWGEFSSEGNWTTGMVGWEAHPSLCIDLSKPFVGQGYTTGELVLQPCGSGNPNKQFHMPRAGKGQMRWAGHSDLCVAVPDGNDLVFLRKCREVPPQWTEFTVRSATKTIVLSARPTSCLTAAKAEKEEGGGTLAMAKCKEGEESQEFKLMEPVKLPGKWEPPRLFCVSLMLPFGVEPELMRLQFDREIGIFACADQAVYSNSSLSFTQGDRTTTTEIMPGSLSVEFGGNWHTALNTEIFIRFWGKVVEDHRVHRNDWTVKLDPDCVFFPRRLQQLLRFSFWSGLPKKPVFLNNCHRGMHGPIEAISKEGLLLYKDRQSECKEGIYAKKWTGYLQEDVYFGICWQEYLKMEAKKAYNLLFEEARACDEISITRDGRHPCFSKQVSFHPFKTAETYLECHKRGEYMTWAQPFMPVSEKPGDWNHHHA